MTSSMRALVGGNGPDWVLDERPIPHPGPGQVLIRNRAVSTNNADLPMLADADPTSKGTGRPFIAGFEYAGEVAEVGAGVDTWIVGDAVMGSAPHAFAEYVLTDQRHVLPRPSDLDPETASALPTGLLTEHGALMKARFVAGQRVLITGASTSIGLIGSQIAKALGASLVIGTTRSPVKRQLLTDAGVDVVIVSSETDLAEGARVATDGQGVDVVLDHVGGATFAQCIGVTTDYGHLVNIGRLDGSTSTISLDDLSYRNLNVHGVSFGFDPPEPMAGIISRLVPEVMPAVSRGEIRPVIDRVLPWTQSSRALARLRSGDAVGKVVLVLTDS